MDQGTLRIETAPTVEPVTLAEAKLWLKIDTTQTDDDDLITSLIKDAREAAEHYCKRVFVSQKWKFIFDVQPTEIKMPLGYVQTVSTVKTYAEDGTATTETSTYYSYDVGELSRLWIKSGYTWTSTTRLHGIFEIAYIVGWYGGTSDTVGSNTMPVVPESVKSAIKMIVAKWYEDRGDSALPDNAIRKLDRYVCHWID